MGTLSKTKKVVDAIVGGIKSDYNKLGTALGGSTPATEEVSSGIKKKVKSLIPKSNSKSALGKSRAGEDGTFIHKRRGGW